MHAVSPASKTTTSPKGHRSLCPERGPEGPLFHGAFELYSARTNLRANNWPCVSPLLRADDDFVGSGRNLEVESVGLVDLHGFGKVQR